MTGIIPIPKDNASAQLLAGVNASSLAFVLKAAEGANFPQPIDGVATSAGDNTTLPSTGIQAAGVVVGDFIYNLTDSDPSSDEWSGAVVLGVSTNSVTTTPLTGGSDNLWESSDEWAVDPFVVNLSKRAGGVLTGAVTQFEKVLITSRSTDTLSIPVASGYRGFDGTTPNTFVVDDFVTIEVDKSISDGMRISLARVYEQLHEDFLRLDGTKPMSGALAMGTNKITGVGDPTSDQDATTKIWVLTNTLPIEPEDNVFRIIDDGDNTKKIAFEASGITTATTRIATMPDKDITLAGIDDVEAIFNTSSIVLTGDASEQTTTTAEEIYDFVSSVVEDNKIWDDVVLDGALVKETLVAGISSSVSVRGTSANTNWTVRLKVNGVVVDSESGSGLGTVVVNLASSNKIETGQKVTLTFQGDADGSLKAFSGSMTANKDITEIRNIT